MNLLTIVPYIYNHIVVVVMDKLISVPLMQEAGVIGLSLLVVFVIIHMLAMVISPEGSMGHAGIFLTVFLAGALTHIVYEATGANDMFIKRRLAAAAP
jgi:hypothetical protein